MVASRRADLAQPIVTLSTVLTGGLSAFSNGALTIEATECAAMAVQQHVAHRPTVRPRRPRNPVGYFAVCALATGLAIVAAPVAERVLFLLGGG
jgi:hypothetical protein